MTVDAAVGTGTLVREQNLYHWLGRWKINRVFRLDTLRPYFAHRGFPPGVSLTRNPRYTHDYGDGAVRLTLSRDALAHRHRIIPLDGNRASQRDRGEDPEDFVDRGGYSRKRGEEMAEEYLVGVIAPLHRYLKRIHIGHHNDDAGIILPTVRFALKHGIPCSVQNFDRTVADLFTDTDDAFHATWREEIEGIRKTLQRAARGPARTRAPVAGPGAGPSAPPQPTAADDVPPGVGPR